MSLRGGRAEPMSGRGNRTLSFPTVIANEEQVWTTEQSELIDSIKSKQYINNLYTIGCNSRLYHRPLNCRGGCYFWLDPKVTKTERSDLMNSNKKQINK